MSKLMDSRTVFGIAIAASLVIGLLPASTAQAQACDPAAATPGGTLDPCAVPKYVLPLVIPPVMNNSGSANEYDLAVREFQQQILPGGIWNTVNGRTDAFPATTVWSYGPDADLAPDSTALGGGAGIAPAPNSQFNYPAYTVENTVDTPTIVDWINDLKENFGAGPNFLQHLLPIDQTLHWANPGADCINDAIRTDCRGSSDALYTGPVPIVTHVHGAHVGPESDGYPEAWWLPDPTDSNFDCVSDPALADPANDVYVCQGTLANGYGYTPNTNAQAGVANYTYPNDQPSTTLWYHDHSLGMTRNNVYAGPAGFWLIRESGGGETGLVTGTLPSPAPVAGEGLATTNFPAALGGSREKYREIPIVIQDRSFNDDGSLFYPANRAFFEGLGDGQLPPPTDGLNIDFIPTNESDISPIWNPEAFFNVMVVNGVSWPELEVAPAIYRFRLLNGCNSRFLNLSMFKLHPKNPNRFAGQLPFYQIGAEQSLLPQVVRIARGEATPLPGDGTVPPKVGTNRQQALLMGLAERADVLVDFRGLKDGTIVRMLNTAPDAPFGGFPDVPADPGTTGQVIQFRVNSALLGQSPTDPTGATPATDPWNLLLSPVENVDIYPGGPTLVTRDLALIEEESTTVCVTINPDGTIDQVVGVTIPFDPLDPANACFAAGGVPFAPKAAVLGVDGSLGGPTSEDPNQNTGAQPTLWSAPIVTNPGVGDTETWELWNHTVDGHPIHLHLVKFKVLDREPFILDPITGAPVLLGPVPPEAAETGWKDTVIAYPGEVTRVAATFDREGLYVWHCHIVEHEDNEMMVPYCVGDPTANGCAGL